MNAEILCVGTEILLGDIANTNAAYIAQGLARMGFGVYHHTVVGDNAERLKNCLSIAFGRCDLVFMTGGLGPTYDDLTKETVAAYFGRELKTDPECLRQLKESFARSGRPMTENNLKQADMPEGAIVLPNPFGTAPGCIVEDGGKAAILMPGPPREMIPMFDGPVQDYLSDKIDGVLVSRNINIYGIGESAVEQKLRPLIAHMKNPSVAPYAGRGELRLRVTARAENAEAALSLVEPVVRDIVAELGDYAYAIDAKNLEQEAVRLLAEQKLTLATAESCTGGLLSARLTDTPGASAVYLGGVVAYANQAKIELLGVSPATLEAHGAVSKETAAQMAEGAALRLGSDMALSTTGIAGPGGGSPDKPVGLVYVALHCRQTGTEVLELQLARGRQDDRENIRQAAASRALAMVIRHLRGGRPLIGA